MLGKKDGRGRVHKVLARSGYGKGGAMKASEHAPSQRHGGIASHLASVEAEVKGRSSGNRLDRKPRGKK